MTEKVNSKIHFEKLLTDFVSETISENRLLQKMIYFLYDHGLEFGCYQGTSQNNDFKNNMSFFTFESQSNVDEDFVEYIKMDKSGFFSKEPFKPLKDLSDQEFVIHKNPSFKIHGYQQIDPSDPSKGWLSKDIHTDLEHLETQFGFIPIDAIDFFDYFDSDMRRPSVLDDFLPRKFFSLIRKHKEVNDINFYRRARSEWAVEEDWCDWINLIIVINYKSGVCEGLAIKHFVH